MKRDGGCDSFFLASIHGVYKHSKYDGIFLYSYLSFDNYFPYDQSIAFVSLNVR